jgi:quercetin dioxygenase-like cupin family protein
MVTTSTNSPSFSTQLKDWIDYSKPGVTRKMIVQDTQPAIALLCLTAGTELAEHSASRMVSLVVIEGRGTFTLEGREIVMEPGVLIHMPPDARHALRAEENLAFLHL